VNAVDWHRKKRYVDLYNYTKNMIALRRLHPVFRLADRQQIDKRLQFRDDWCPSPNCLAFRLDGHALEGEAWNETIVLINADNEDLNFPLPAATWKVYVQGENASTSGLFTTHDQVAVNAKSVVIAAR
jgi:pullulanase